MNPDGTNKKNLTNNAAGESARNSSFSPDGKLIAYQSNQDGNEEIYVMRFTGSDKTRLTNNPEPDQWPSFSPDGSKITFMNTRDANQLQIYAMDADGSNQTNISNSGESDFAPNWGTRVTIPITPQLPILIS